MKSKSNGTRKRQAKGDGSKGGRKRQEQSTNSPSPARQGVLALRHHCHLSPVNCAHPGQAGVACMHCREHKGRGRRGGGERL